MRGKREIQGATFSDLTQEQRVPMDHPLGAKVELVDAPLDELSPPFDALYAKRMGRHADRAAAARRVLLAFDPPRPDGD